MVTAKILRYKAKVNKDGTSPIVLQIIFERKPKKISLGGDYKCTTDHWNEATREFTRSFKDYKEKNKVLRSIEARANVIIDDFLKTGKPFSFNAFEELFRTPKKQTPSVFDLFDTRIAEMRSKNEISNADIYASLKSVLSQFESNKNLAFTDVDYKFLTRFETFLKERGNNSGGQLSYMKAFRALINEGLKRGYLSRELYPYKNQFNNDGYSFSHIKSNARPRALSENDLAKIKVFPIAKYPDLDFAYKIFIFGYYSRGMNITDIAKLKKSDVYNNRINYTRTKTGKQLSIEILEQMKDIIKEFENAKSEYVFPILNETYKTAEEIKNRIHGVTRQVNDKLKKIGKILEIDVDLTTYVSRHTYATTLKRNGGDIAKISESLGHSDINTTNAYLKRFDDSELDVLGRLL